MSIKEFLKNLVWSAFRVRVKFSQSEKPYSTQHAALRLLQKWQKELNSGGLICAVLMDLSKAYDCLLYDLLIEKLEAYGLDNDSLNFLLGITSVLGNEEPNSILLMVNGQKLDL